MPVSKVNRWQNRREAATQSLGTFQWEVSPVACLAQYNCTVLWVQPGFLCGIERGKGG